MYFLLYAHSTSTVEQHQQMLYNYFSMKIKSYAFIDV